MRIFLIISFIFSVLSATDWINTGSSIPSDPEWIINSPSDNVIELSFQLNGYFIKKDSVGNTQISFPGGVPILQSGAPDLPRMARSIIIPNLAHMELSIVETKFFEIEVQNILPSKGNLTRDINPESVPYSFGKPYELDAWYPENISFLRDPYILRTLRGQAVVFQPFQYNPKKKILRVYTHIKINVQENGESQINPLTKRPSGFESREFEYMYQDHFINYPNNLRYDVLTEHGPMLIISHGTFMDEMQPFVDWKNYKGIPTEIIDIASIGDVDDMAQFISDKYYENGIAYVLLVGDIAQIETVRRSNGAGSNSPSDNSLTFVAGNDSYPDLIIGRFSAETGNHVETMVNRTISYEMNPDSESDWYKKGSGYASDQGPGDDGEYDDEHMDIIRELLLGYNYIEIDQIYDPSGTVAQGEVALNEGRSIINYTGHGSNSSFGNGCPMNNTDVNGLENFGKWPFIWSVACVNGEFHVGTCFAETWLRATGSDGSPTGAISTLMSTVNQGWNPPMEGQDEMNAILAESISGNIKRTFGGLSFNGMNQMNDSYGSQGYDETYYWTIFGDPSVVVRTDTPTNIEVNHDDIVILGASEFSIETSISDALVAISRDGALLSSGYTDLNGTLVLEFDENLDIPGTIDLVVTAYNKVPYINSINVIAPEGAYMLMNDVNVVDGNNNSLDYGETVSLYTTFQNVGQDSSGELIFLLTHEGSSIEFISQEIISVPAAPDEELIIGPFEFSVNWNIDNGTSLPFSLQAINGSDSWEYSTSLNVSAPEFQLVSMDFLNDVNGTLDPGETVLLQVSMKNIGSSPISYPTFEMTTSDPFISFGEVASDNAYWWDVNEFVTISFEITASNDAPIGHNSVSGIVVGALNTPYSATLPLPITMGLMIEDFETGDFSAFSWSHNGQADWTISSSESHSGDFSAKSGDIGNNQISELSIDMNVLYEGQLQFSAKASSEMGGSGTIYDYLEFYINDDAQNLMIGGDTNWEDYSVQLPQGIHTLRWVYHKDNASSSGSDCVWIDRIIFPPGAVAPLNIDFGDLNSDNIVNILDVIVTVNYIIGHVELDPNQLQNADMNLDGIVNVLDILMIVDLALDE